MTGLGDLVPGASAAGLAGEASSLGSLAGLLTLNLLLETGPCLFDPLDPLFRFLLPSTPPIVVPFGVT